MKVFVSKLPESQVELKIEVPAGEFNSFIEKAILNLGEDLEIKGFRKGKAPKEVIEKKAGPEKILIEAADLAVKENYRKAILENKIEAIFQPEVKIQKLVRGDSFIFLAKTAVLPEIELPDYKRIASKVERKKIIVEEKEITGALNWLQKSRAKFTLKNQPAQKGDFVEIEYWSPQIAELNQQAGKKDAFILGEGHFVPGFEEKLIGMNAGKEEKEFSLAISEEHPLRKYGREITFKVKMNSVQNTELPEINDLFAKSLGKFENLSALKKNIEQGISFEKKQAELQRARKEILEKISQKVKCEIPKILIEQEQKQILERIKKEISSNLKISFEEYLSKIKKTEKEILDSLLLEAQKKVRNFLILREIGKREKIEVSAEELREEVNKILRQHPTPKGAEKNLSGIDFEELKEYTKESIKNEKIFQLLEKR